MLPDKWILMNRKKQRGQGVWLCRKREYGRAGKLYGRAGKKAAIPGI